MSDIGTSPLRQGATTEKKKKHDNNDNIAMQIITVFTTAQLKAPSSFAPARAEGKPSSAPSSAYFLGPAKIETWPTAWTSNQTVEASYEWSCLQPRLRVGWMIVFFQTHHDQPSNNTPQAPSIGDIGETLTPRVCLVISTHPRINWSIGHELKFKTCCRDEHLTWQIDVHLPKNIPTRYQPIQNCAQSSRRKCSKATSHHHLLYFLMIYTVYIFHPIIFSQNSRFSHYMYICILCSNCIIFSDSVYPIKRTKKN